MKITAAACLVSVFLAASPGSAQTSFDGVAVPPAPAADESGPPSDYSFGGQPQDLVVHAITCQPRTSTPHLIHGTFQYFGNDVSSLGQYNCPVVIPNGARITGVECLVRDASSSDITIQLFRTTVDVVTNVPGGSTVLATMTSSGTSGFQTLSTTLAVPETARRRSGNNRNAYILFVVLPDVAANASLRDCTIIWNRQVSPAPATASFGDVPVSHAQFRFIEALAAAGITGGCGGGNYCPDTPLTRGQMAVFLSAALGLHFPN